MSLATNTPRRRAQASIRALMEIVGFDELCLPVSGHDPRGWAVVGSYRRGEKVVNDVEIVANPKPGSWTRTERASGLFQEEKVIEVRGPLLWRRLDELLDEGLIAHPDRGKCWGALIRRFHFQEIPFEIYVANPENFGTVKAIRTGPASLSRALMIRARSKGVRFADGFRLFSADRRTEPIPIPSEAALWRALELRLSSWHEPKTRADLGAMLAQNPHREDL